jgi:hypothetical protein
VDIIKAPGLIKPRSLRKLNQGASENKRKVVSESIKFSTLSTATERFALPFFDTWKTLRGGQLSQVLMKRDELCCFLLANPLTGGVNVMLPSLMINKTYTTYLAAVLLQCVT